MTEDIYRIKNELLQMVYDHDWGGYQRGVQAERDRIIKVIEDSVGNMTAEVIIERIKEGTK
jgi:hypothetical protein